MICFPVQYLLDQIFRNGLIQETQAKSSSDLLRLVAILNQP